MLHKQTKTTQKPRVTPMGNDSFVKYSMSQTSTGPRHDKRQACRRPSNDHSIWRSEPLVYYVSGVAGLCRFEHHDLRFRLSHSAMLHATRHHTELARLQTHVTVAKLDRYLVAP